VVALDCKTLKVVRRYESPHHKFARATSSVSAACDLLIAESTRPGTTPETEYKADNEYVAFDLSTGKVNEHVTSLFQTSDRDVGLFDSDGCKIYVIRQSEPQPVLFLRTAYIEARLEPISELWEIEVDTRTQRRVVSFPGTPTVEGLLVADGPPVLSSGSTHIGLHTRRVEVEYERDGRLLLGNYDRMEVVDLKGGQILPPVKCSRSGNFALGAFFVDNEYGVLAGCDHLLVGRIGSAEASEVTLGSLGEGAELSAISYVMRAKLLVVAVRGPYDSRTMKAKSEIRIYRVSQAAN
jgi:hypothetical protein